MLTTYVGGTRRRFSKRVDGEQTKESKPKSKPESKVVEYSSLFCLFSVRTFSFLYSVSKLFLSYAVRTFPFR